MIRKYLVPVLLLGGTMLIQTTLTEPLRIYIRPDFILVLITLFALAGGGRSGVVLAGGAGLLVDLWLGRMVGMHFLSLVTVAVAVGFLEDKVFKENLGTPPMVVFFASLLQAAVIMIMGYVAGTRFFGLSGGLFFAVAGAVYNSIAALLICLPTFRIWGPKGLLAWTQGESHGL